MMSKKKREIEYIWTVWDELFYPRKLGEALDECKVKYVGMGCYLVGYFDFNKAGCSNFGGNPVNKWIMLYPSGIKKIVYK